MICQRLTKRGPNGIKLYRGGYAHTEHVPRLLYATLRAMPGDLKLGAIDPMYVTTTQHENATCARLKELFRIFATSNRGRIYAGYIGLYAGRGMFVVT